MLMCKAQVENLLNKVIFLLTSTSNKTFYPLKLDLISLLNYEQVSKIHLCNNKLTYFKADTLKGSWGVIRFYMKCYLKMALQIS